MSATSILLAAGAAGCNAFSSVLQRKANRDVPIRRGVSPAVVVRLVLRPAWLLGILAMIASFLLQAAALNAGTLSAVEPVLVIELPLTLIIGSWLLSHRLRNTDWLSAAAMALGLAVFIVALAPSGGDAGSVADLVAVTATVATAVGITALVLAGRFGPDRTRAALFGAAAGSGFGLTASLMKIAVARLAHDGVSGLVGAWETYGVVVCGVSSVVLVQVALQAGTLVAAQPGITLLDPLVSLLWGTIVLGESTRTGPVLLVAALGGLIIVTAVLVLARSAALHRHWHGPAADSAADSGTPQIASAPRRGGSGACHRSAR